MDLPITGEEVMSFPKRIYTSAYSSFRVFGPTLDPLHVTIALRLPPDHTHRNGEPRLNRTRNGSVKEYSTYRCGMWSMSSEKWVTSPRLAVHLEWLLHQLEPRADALTGLGGEGIIMDFFCYSAGNSPLPPSLPQALLARATALGVVIDIDHFGPPAAPDTSP